MLTSENKRRIDDCRDVLAGKLPHATKLVVSLNEEATRRCARWQGSNHRRAWLGRSLVTILDDVTSRVHPTVFQVYPRGTPGGPGLGQAVRTERHRYVEWRAWKTGEVLGRELYDYQTDPGETENLAARPEHAKLLKELTARLAALGSAKPPVKKDPTIVEPANAQ
jgi:hypothetical protein